MKEIWIALMVLGWFLCPRGWAQDLEDLLQPGDCFCATEEPSGRHWEVNPELCSRPELPASTFKIANTLIGLETGVIPNPSFRLPWDGQKRWVEAWNQDHNLKSAFQNSVVWYYQEVARRIGPERMTQWLERLQYGNKSIAGGIDRFWLDGGMRISPLQQIQFLQRLHDNDLPLKQSTMDQARAVMFTEKIGLESLFAKTGWAKLPDQNLGWYVGWVQDSQQKVIYFAYNCRRPEPTPENFAANRVRVTRACLHRLGWLGSEGSD